MTGVQTCALPIWLDIDPETGLLLQTRPAFGGNLMATIVTDRHKPQMATVRPGVLPVLPSDRSRRGTICTVAPPPVTGRVVELARMMRHNEPGIADADIIVSAGRGIGSRYLGAPGSADTWDSRGSRN